MRKLGTLAASLWLLAAVSARAALVEVRAPAAGWTLPAAVRAVALNAPSLALPPGVTEAEIAALPEASPVWALAARRVASSAALDKTPEEAVGAALASIAAGTGVPKPLNPRSSLEERALAWSRGSAKRGLALGEAGAAALAAPGVDPGLIVSQFGVQNHKHLFRTIEEYDERFALRSSILYTLPNSSYESSRAVVPRAASLAPLFKSESPLRAMIADLRERHGSVTWADAGGGFGVAQRQLSKEGLGTDVKRVLVDLFDWEKLRPRGTRRLGKGFFSGRDRPDLLLADAAAVRFPRGGRPNLITSIESIQYWPDKIRVLANLYNQLEDGGLLAIAADHKWGSWIRTRGMGTSYTSTLFDDLIATLARAGIEVAAVVEPSSPVEDLRTLVIRKKEGTRLVQNASLKDTWTNRHGYTAGYYGKLRKGRAPIEVLGGLGAPAREE